MPHKNNHKAILILFMGWFKSFFRRERNSTGDTHYSDCHEDSIGTSPARVIEREFGFHDSGELARFRLKTGSITTIQNSELTPIRPQNAKEEPTTSIVRRVGRRAKDAKLTDTLWTDSGKDSRHESDGGLSLKEPSIDNSEIQYGLNPEQKRLADEITCCICQMKEDVANIHIGLSQLSAK